jgi:Putative beta-barrel porin-2, OmpL-like. bbp2
MLRKLLVTSLALFSLFVVRAQDSAKKAAPTVAFTGSADAYYRYNFNNPPAFPYNSPTSFTHSNNTFELGMASIRADASFGKASATVDLGFGPRAAEFSYNDVGTSTVAIKQLYISYQATSAIKFTIGTWGTHIGYEVLDAYLNRNYSMSYMFTNGPFSQTGLKADISLGGKSSLMVGISNPTDYRSASNMPKTAIAQFATASKDDKLKLYLNFEGGAQSDLKSTLQGDVVINYNPTSKLGLGFNGTVQGIKSRATSDDDFVKSTWWGSALYVNVDPSTLFGFTVRGEYIGNSDGWITNGNGQNLGNVFEGTLSFNFRIDNLTIIPEIRIDAAQNSAFYKNATETATSTVSALLAVTYHF